MNIHKRNDVSIYCLSSGPTLPEWLGDRAKRNLSKRDESIRRRIELIQDFQMPSSSSKIVQSADGRYIIAAGTYPPRIKCYDVHELSMKFERYLDSHVVDIVMLGEDYGKMALLLEDRTIAFHAPYGAHTSMRIPSFGRAMAYEPTTCELLVAAKGNRVFRINLEEGRFSEPWSFESTSNDDVSSSCIAVAPSHPLATVGCDDGVVRFWDNRTPDSLLKPFLQLDVHRATAGRGFADDNLGYVNTKEITSIAHDPNGLYMACGTGGGLVAVYDIRSSRPLYVQEHKNGTAILNVKFHSSGNILSMDEKLVKVWRYKSSRDMTTSSSKDESIGSVLTNVEGTGNKLTNFIIAGDETDPDGYNSGLLLCAGYQPKMESYYIPKLGLAPRWCSFLENITEELEERDLKRKGDADSGLVRDGDEAIYENYKFVSRDEVDELGISNLIGTPMLRGYMHGFFMDINLHNRVKAVANPFEYEEYRKKKLKERLEAKRASRIAPKKDPNNRKQKSKTTVNPDLADRLKGKAGSDTKAGKVASTLLADERFGNLFTDPNFEIDEKDEDFRLRNPSGVAVSNAMKNDLDSDDEGSIPDDEDGQGRASDDDDHDGEAESVSDNSGIDDDSDSDEDGVRGGKVRGENYEETKRFGKQNKKRFDKTNSKKATKRVVYEADDLEEVNNSADNKRRQRGSSQPGSTSEMNLPLAKRLALEKNTLLDDQDKLPVASAYGAKEITYVPKNARKNERQEKGADPTDSGSGRRGKRRGVKELGLRKPEF